MEKTFFTTGEMEWETLEGNMKRTLLGYDRHIMMVKVSFEKGAIGHPHSHPHSQTSYVETGKFEVTIGGKTTVLTAGDAYYVPSNVEHGAVNLEPGTVIDVFSPMREDIL